MNSVLVILGYIGIGAGYSFYKIVEYFFYGMGTLTYILLNLYVQLEGYNRSSREQEYLTKYYNSICGWEYINELSKLNSKYTSSFLRYKYSKSKNEVDFIKKCTGKNDTYEDFSIDAVD
jgi:hypothetical protein